MFLKKSTAATVMLGPFVDAADGFTAETGLTISQADVRISKEGGAFAQTGNANAATHAENGWYSKALATSDVDMCGRLTIAVNESGARPVLREFMVLEADIYNTLCGMNLSDAICQKIAHVVLRRTMANVEAATDGDTLNLSSLYGVIQMLQEFAISGTTLTTFKVDGTTSLGTKTVSKTGGDQPIRGIS